MAVFFISKYLASFKTKRDNNMKIEPEIEHRKINTATSKS